MEISIPVADEYYVFLARPSLNLPWVTPVALQENGVTRVEIVVPMPSFQLYSPRTTNLTSSPILFRDRAKVYYYTEIEAYADIYEFIFACRASKNTDNYYLISATRNPSEIRAQAIKPYNLVSGEKLPINMSVSAKRSIHRYMLMGLHLYWTYLNCGLSGSKIVTCSNSLSSSSVAQSRVVSVGDHRFGQEQGWVINVSSIFPGLLIDYYRLESGMVGVNAQLAFLKDPEFRFLVYRYMREVFLAFLKHNHTDDSNQEMLRKLATTDGLTDQEIISNCAKILSELV